MKELFADLPEAISNIQEIVDKVEVFSLARDVLLPAFDIPKEFQDKLDEEDGGKRGGKQLFKTYYLSRSQKTIWRDYRSYQRALGF